MRSRKTRGLLLAGAALVAAGAFVALAFHPPPGPRSLARFEPDRLADLELAMWQAYYRKEKLRVFRLLVVTLREQYRYSWARAAEAGLHLARAAAAFGEARGGYERVLPDLERAYTSHATGRRPASTRARWPVRSSSGGRRGATPREGAPRTSAPEVRRLLRESYRSLHAAVGASR